MLRGDRFEDQSARVARAHPVLDRHADREQVHVHGNRERRVRPGELPLHGRALEQTRIASLQHGGNRQAEITAFSKPVQRGLG